MKFLTQTNVAILFAVQVMWGVYMASGILPHAHWVDAVTVTFNALTAGLAFLGFNRTPSGNRLPPEVITQVDRQAVSARAQDAVVQAAADKATEAAKAPDVPTIEKKG
jgi:hypothetical protein